MKDSCLLIGDIGGTNARFALADPGRTAYTGERSVVCANYETAGSAITDYLEHTGASKPSVICLASAGPIIDGSVRFTNNHWRINNPGLQAIFPTANVNLLNDFEAIAYALPFLDESQLATIGPATHKVVGKTDFTLGILGAGTGLGIAGLMGRGGAIYPIAGEGGHTGFAPESQLQLQVLKQLWERFERVSDERLLSGPGLENIYWALSNIHGKRGSHLSAPEIFQRALTSEDIHATNALQLFYEALGQVAGNLALSLGAYDGIYIAGGIVKRYPDLFMTSKFRSGFENKGRHRSLTERIPTVLILHPQPGLLGAAYKARQMYQVQTH